MKKTIAIFSSLLLAFSTLQAAPLHKAEDLDAKKSKSFSKSYPLSSSDKVSLDNSFGEMKISTWSKNEIKVDVSITVEAETDEIAQRLLDLINIEDSKNAGEVIFKTKIGDKDKNKDKDKDHGRGNHTSFKINYQVSLPSNTALNAVNQFGSLVIGDYDGPATIIAKFGSLTAGKLSNPKKVAVEFGSGTIESLSNGKLDIKFSSAQVNKISGDITADFEQSHGVKLNLDNNLKKLDLRVNFSDVLLDADKNLSASFNIKNSFGSFSNKSDFSINRNTDNDNRYYNKNENYSGKAGSGNIPVDIKNNFGTVTIGHNLPFEVKEKGSRKTEKRTRV
jgi:hypothetical protein